MARWSVPGTGPNRPATVRWIGARQRGEAGGLARGQRGERRRCSQLGELDTVCGDTAGRPAARRHRPGYGGASFTSAREPLSQESGDTHPSKAEVVEVDPSPILRAKVCVFG
ncbi:hypothetical protein PR202_gb23880 [Eleusine coracana subsp. coracana]|uniref:Uncharacterized protein n=1 Tax=Eleusine coracana subsp. coracana TaxID=191504 RepID=A0AAV5FK14_ELECO|nr:hypothetical protein PR202_gb23880 [Eleusine coracana subsp. coracana]